MLDLESRADEHGITSIVLETGGLQPAAHGLYESLGYARIDAFAPYGFFPGSASTARRCSGTPRCGTAS
jgi:hypothetical protein